jgi:hypothetical protein
MRVDDGQVLLQGHLRPARGAGDRRNRWRNQLGVEAIQQQRWPRAGPRSPAPAGAGPGCTPSTSPASPSVITGGAHLGARAHHERLDLVVRGALRRPRSAQPLEDHAAFP